MESCKSSHKYESAKWNWDENLGPNKLYEVLCDHKAQTQENRIERPRKKRIVQ